MNNIEQLPLTNKHLFKHGDCQTMADAWDGVKFFEQFCVINNFDVHDITLVPTVVHRYLDMSVGDVEGIQINYLSTKEHNPWNLDWEDNYFNIHD